MEGQSLQTQNSYYLFSSHDLDPNITSWKVSHLMNDDIEAQVFAKLKDSVEPLLNDKLFIPSSSLIWLQRCLTLSCPENFTGSSNNFKVDIPIIENLEYSWFLSIRPKTLANVQLNPIDLNEYSDEGLSIPERWRSTMDLDDLMIVPKEIFWHIREAITPRQFKDIEFKHPRELTPLMMPLTPPPTSPRTSPKLSVLATELEYLVKEDKKSSYIDEIFTPDQQLLLPQEIMSYINDTIAPHVPTTPKCKRGREYELEDPLTPSSPQKKRFTPDIPDISNWKIPFKTSSPLDLSGIFETNESIMESIFREKLNEFDALLRVPLAKVPEVSGLSILPKRLADLTTDFRAFEVPNIKGLDLDVSWNPFSEKPSIDFGTMTGDDTPDLVFKTTIGQVLYKSKFDREDCEIFLEEAESVEAAPPEGTLQQTRNHSDTPMDIEPGSDITFSTLDDLVRRRTKKKALASESLQSPSRHSGLNLQDFLLLRGQKISLQKGSVQNLELGKLSTIPLKDVTIIEQPARKTFYPDIPKFTGDLIISPRNSKLLRQLKVLCPHATFFERDLLLLPNDADADIIPSVQCAILIFTISQIHQLGDTVAKRRIQSCRIKFDIIELVVTYSESISSAEMRSLSLLSSMKVRWTLARGNEATTAWVAFLCAKRIGRTKLTEEESSEC
ncbi:hypothetical protein NEOLI_003772 [Neolecta irregularis DAH-3]|uniref:Uncharacterized protein n=1 Tax=Neolecta irregularis (strain DAH-3) TaxID=1198029 RepID=A0A1U7LQ74_NEOID|nr:hypothetical protein NEOLI_003772 [Neolecta irregularis DAH-3]|eukprot:OLL24671.1 hypothetical protein NEOLI_003772 [Neolecta irregularis DAH-3]